MIANFMKGRISTHLLTLALVLVFAGYGCKVNYSMTGASISPEVKTINVKFFTKTAALGPPSMGQTFTELLKQKFINETSLSVISTAADLTFEGTISSYSVAPQAIQSNETAARNRLTVTVNVKFTNLKDEKQNFETTFTRFADFPSSSVLNSVEDQLISEINSQLIDDIFNKAVINW